MEVPQEALQNYHQEEPNGSSARPGERLYALKIRNTSSCSSGTYRCTLVAPEGQRNQSGIVILKVTGKVLCCTSFLTKMRVHFL